MASDRLITEQPSNYDHLERMSAAEIVRCINEEDKKVALAVEKCLPRIAEVIERATERMKRGGRLFYIGAGTSGRLGVLDASELPTTFGAPPGMVIGIIAGGDVALRSAVENAEDNQKKGWADVEVFKPTPQDTLVGIAASGTTPYVVGACREARRHGLLTACITSNSQTPLAAEVDIPIEMIVGPEFVTGSSRMKSGTGQKMILNMISTGVMIGLGCVKGNKMIRMQLTNSKLVRRGTRMLQEMLGIDETEARRVLLEYGSVEQAMRKYRQ